MNRNILVVVDYQNDFVDGALGFPGAEKLDAGIAQKISEAEGRGDYIIFTFDTHQKSYLKTREGKALPIPHCIEGTPGHDLYGKTGEKFREVLKNGKAPVITLNKETFGISPLDEANLPWDEPETIEFVGLVTNMCVLANVCCFQAMYPNAQIIVHANLCDSFNKELHQKTLDVLRGMQVEVRED